LAASVVCSRSVERVQRKSGVVWRVRWRENGQPHSRRRQQTRRRAVRGRHHAPQAPRPARADRHRPPDRRRVRPRMVAHPRRPRPADAPALLRVIRPTSTHGSTPRSRSSPSASTTKLTVLRAYGERSDHLLPDSTGTCCCGRSSPRSHDARLPPPSMTLTSRRRLPSWRCDESPAASTSSMAASRPHAGRR
jgi:hypothetical protein